MVFYSKQKQTPPKPPPQQKKLTREERRKATYKKYNAKRSAKRSRLKSLQKELQEKIEIKRGKNRLASFKYYHKPKPKKAGASTMSQQTPSRNTPRDDENEPYPVTTLVSLVSWRPIVSSQVTVSDRSRLSFHTVWVWSHDRRTRCDAGTTRPCDASVVQRRRFR